MPAPPDLRLIVITDFAIAHPRSAIEVVRASLAAGAPAVQLRMKGAAPSALLEVGRELRVATRDAHALLFVNDRVDVALALGADGVHLGPDDLPVAAIRNVVPPRFLVGCSTDDPAVAARAERDGADYIGCGAVFGTRSKDVGGERIGVDQLARVVRATRLPVVGIGGITPANAAAVAATGAAGVAVIGAVMAAPDPGDATRRLLDAFRDREAPGRD